ncbi:MAG: glycosyltransferase [Burkholderiaceae bacterium]|nr:glycosyltransferase [Burkholderiaceae bacterium]
MVPARFDRERPLGLLVKRFPKLSETFILEEILGLERLAVPLRLYALESPTDTVVHPAVARVRAPLAQVPEIALGQLHGLLAGHLRLIAACPYDYVSALARAVMRGRRGLGDFARAGWLAARLRDDGVKHLHTHFISTPADVAQLAARMAAIPFSISAHAKDIYLSAPKDLRRKLKAAGFTVTCTEANREMLAQIAPTAAIHRMYHGVDFGQFHPRHREPVSTVPLILSVGRLREKKGLNTLIDACRLLHARRQAFCCEIIGYGEERDRLQAQIAQAGLSSQVRLLGKLPREQVIARYARAAVYVQPSRITANGDRDGIPNVLLEAMAMELPVVATEVSGIPELVRHGHNGVLVPPDDPASLSDAIATLLGRPQLCDQLGRRARETVTQSFDNDHNLQLLCMLLETRDECSAHDIDVRPAVLDAKLGG